MFVASQSSRLSLWIWWKTGLGQNSFAYTFDEIRKLPWCYQRWHFPCQPNPEVHLDYRPWLPYSSVTRWWQHIKWPSQNRNEPLPRKPEARVKVCWTVAIVRVVFWKCRLWFHLTWIIHFRSATYVLSVWSSSFIINLKKNKAGSAYQSNNARNSPIEKMCV